VQITYQTHPVTSGVYWMNCVGAFIGAVFCFIVIPHLKEGKWFAGTLGIVFLTFGTVMLVRTETIIDTAARVVRRRSRLLGRYPIRTQTTEFAELQSVLVRHWRRSNSAEDPDTYWVFLQRQSKRKLLISYFEADENRGCRPAEELANRLAADLSLEIVEQTW
jgi:hypothetical protein